MKVTKIPGLGSFGIYIDDVDFNNITKEEWLEIGYLHIDNLVTIIRNSNLNYKNMLEWCEILGPRRHTSLYTICKHYPGKTVSDVVQMVKEGSDEILDEHRELIENVMLIRAPGGVQRVSGKKNKQGKPLGMFQEGELLWHSNESGNIAFTPGVALLGAENMVGSSTGFLQTADYYQSVTESFRSELDDMILIHKFMPGKINPGLNHGQDNLMKINMCPEDNELPMVIQSPGGIRGLHYSVNTVWGIKGMSKTDADQVFKEINKTLVTDKYIYDHWYETNNDLLLFDNSITVHRRLGDVKDRLAYRVAHTYDNIAGPYQPYLNEEYKTQYNLYTNELNNYLQGVA